MLDFELPNYEQDYNNKSGEIVLAEGMCVTLLNVQFIFDIIVHNYRYYARKYKSLIPIMNRSERAVISLSRLLYHENQDKIFLARKESLKLTADAMSADDFAQAHKYFIFTDLKVKPPEVAAPQMLKEHPESVCLAFHHVLATNHQDNKAPATEHHDGRLHAEQPEQRHSQGVPHHHSRG